MEKLGKEESRERDPSEWWSQRVGIWWLIMWEGGEADEGRGGEVDLGEEGLASEGADKQEDKTGKRRRCQRPECPTWEWAR